ncbi:Putative organic solvent tolerance protein OstA (modular protein) [Desulfamplus magnetovallimortis]|uniref:Putative organic solvent tolerance protein OstA (Modular protein) n=1 Tax=Desulfamplus magnetovallimortis TaxID=1246637 RepID=A0A1W1H4R7_9BACT|nr:LptA/OstA family protein [Desulfamplus magnetovallimortis]SLM27432.1 Putative organic solvent tolerance protein OstA (modular protein) [Desulfamplus magnetovallimortis]
MPKNFINFLLLLLTLSISCQGQLRADQKQESNTSINTPMKISQKKSSVSRPVEEPDSESRVEEPHSETRQRENNKKLVITSDSMTVEKASSTIRFSGNVVATRENEVIKADTITVTLEEKKEKTSSNNDAKQDIREMTASGNVQFTSDNKKAFADHAIYRTADQTLVLTGDSPRVETDDSYITGKKIILDQLTGKITVEGDGARRVEALFNSRDTIVKP